ncbi:hypothetical protein SI65_08395 [Aspergillus cristatus]|uniref:Uncharacterized protein n=1 Tax=Aspergillus cristatus TaxID=573508 RepID=A0A1E3B5Z5_ASPCR|nr:hypothetical protein SI65_08395 [Aspergillus cristatus]
MGYISGLRSLSHHSTLGIPTDLSARALAIAERVHYLLRKANEHATKRECEEAERTASAGVEQLKMSVFELSEHLPYNEGLRDCLEEDKCLEKILTERVSPSPVTCH